MRLPLTIRVDGGAMVSKTVAERLEAAAPGAGWQRAACTLPGTLVFKAPTPHTRTPPHVGVWLDPDTQKLLISVSDPKGDRVWTPSDAHDQAVNKFLFDLVVPILEAGVGDGASLSIFDVGGIERLVPEPVGTAFRELVSEREKDPDEFDPERSTPFQRAVALVHLTGTCLDRATLVRWLEEDVHWPKDAASSLGYWLEEGLAFLRSRTPITTEGVP